MDLLAQRYASPFSVLDNFIVIRQLHEFTISTLETIAKEKVHKARWECWLHKCYDMPFEEYVRQCENQEPEKAEMTPEQIGNVISDSRNILEGFVPE